MGTHTEIMEYLYGIDEQHTADNSYVCPICGRRVAWAEDDDLLHFDVYNPKTHELLGTFCQDCYETYSAEEITSKLKEKYDQSVEWDEGYELS